MEIMHDGHESIIEGGDLLKIHTIKWYIMHAKNKLQEAISE